MPIIRISTRYGSAFVLPAGAVTPLLHIPATPASL